MGAALLGVLVLTTFDRREEAIENLFAHDEELQFKAEARRGRMLATWVAHLKGWSGADADLYIADIVSSTVTRGGEQALFERVRGDLSGLDVTETTLRERMAAFMVEAVAYVKAA